LRHSASCELAVEIIDTRENAPLPRYLGEEMSALLVRSRARDVAPTTPTPSEADRGRTARRHELFAITRLSYLIADESIAESWSTPAPTGHFLRLPTSRSRGGVGARVLAQPCSSISTSSLPSPVGEESLARRVAQAIDEALHHDAGYGREHVPYRIVVSRRRSASSDLVRTQHPSAA